MKYIDDIIKFLSSEMNGEEESHFRQQLEVNKDLNSEYLQINSIWIKLREHLSIKTDEENISREELIAEIIAEQDIHTYTNENESERTKKFRTHIQDITNNESKRKGFTSQRLYLILLSSAAIITLFLLIKVPSFHTEELITNYYSTENESLINNNLIHTRTDSITALYLFSKQSYQEAIKLFEKELIHYPEDKLLTLCYGLSCYEIDLFDKSITILESIANDKSSIYSDLAAWYLSLIYAKEEHIEKSKAWLIIVKDRKCMYSRDANKLLKKL